MRTRRLIGAAMAAVLGLSLVPTSAQAAPAATEPLYGITAGNTLVSFAAGTPGNLTSSRAILGLPTGETIVGSDFRPANGALYVLTSASRLYTVDPATGTATLRSTLSTPLAGTHFGVDFNPVADRLRITSDTDQNLRVNVDTGAAIVDGTIAYSGGTPNPSEVAVGYTNPVSGATSTALYGIDTTADTLVTQDANVGTLTTVGSLTVNAGSVTSLDVASDGALVAGITLDGATTTGYYTINPTTGAATLVGAIGGSSVVTSVLVPLKSQARTFGLSADGRILTMEGQGVARVTRAATITGLQGGETLTGIDVRPATGQLFGLGTTGRLYVLDPATGVAVQQGAVITPTLTGTAISIDFNPTVDRLRIVTSSGQNLRVNPETGGAATVDTSLAYAATDAANGTTPNVAAAGYTNSVAGATTTVLYGIDTGIDRLVRQDPPNAGTLNSVGTTLGAGLNFNDSAGLDIAANGTAIAVNTVSTTSTLYNVDLTTGAATVLGTVPTAINDIAIADSPGYRFVASDGGVFTYGGARFAGSTGSLTLNQPVVGMSPRLPGNGYWLVASDGGIFSFGGAEFFGSTGGQPLNQPVVGMASTPSGKGYWLVASDGGIFTFGDAAFFGSTGSLRLNKPIVGMAATKSGNGYYLFASDGGVFTYGDATFYGSGVAAAAGKTVVGAALSANGYGYYMTTADGSVVNVGAGAPFKGSALGIPLNRPIVGITVDPTGKGYWLTASDGGVFSYGTDFFGSTGSIPLNRPIVGIAAS